MHDDACLSSSGFELSLQEKTRNEVFSSSVNIRAMHRLVTGKSPPGIAHSMLANFVPRYVCSKQVNGMGCVYEYIGHLNPKLIYRPLSRETRRPNHQTKLRPGFNPSFRNSLSYARHARTCTHSRRCQPYEWQGISVGSACCACIAAVHEPPMPQLCFHSNLWV